MDPQAKQEQVTVAPKNTPVAANSVPQKAPVFKTVREDEDGPVTYICGDCGEENILKPGNVIQRQECGYRVLYKKRTRRIIEYQAR